MDETGEFEGSIRKTWSFTDGTLHLDDPVHEKGLFCGQGADLTGFVHEKGHFRGQGVDLTDYVHEKGRFSG